MGDSSKYRVYIKPFKAGSREGLIGLHGFGSSYHGDIVYIDKKITDKKYKLVLHRSASNLTTNPLEFTLDGQEWYKIKEIFSETPRAKPVGRLKPPLESKETPEKIQGLLKKIFTKHLGTDADLEFMMLKP